MHRSVGVMVVLAAIGSNLAPSFSRTAPGFSSLRSSTIRRSDDIASRSLSPGDDYRGRARSVLASVPLRFEADADTSRRTRGFISRGAKYSVYLGSGGAELRETESTENDLSKSDPGLWDSMTTGSFANPVKSRPRVRNNAANIIRIRFIGANRNAAPEPVQELPEKVNYFRGDDPAQWRTNVVTFAKVMYRNVYPGVDVVYYGAS
jgi:hypothetical protein